jgi:hypothetical protein
VKSHERPLGSSRSRGCSRTGSSRSRGRGRSRTGKRAGAYGYAPQKPYRPPIPSRIARQTRFGGNCSRKPCARKACVGKGGEQSRSRSRLSTRHDTTRLASATAMAWHGKASERARHAFSFYQLHKWSTVGAPFKLVKILIDFQCRIESLAFICGHFNS